MSEKNGRRVILTQGTLIPIGMAALVLSAVITGAWYLSGVSKQVEITRENVADLQAQSLLVPSRTEIANQIAPINATLNTIQADIKLILSNKNR